MFITHVSQPPIWLIDRRGRTNVTLPMLCPAHLVPTARLISAAIASSLAPSRNIARKSNSVVENKHVLN
jgi:hypothetical protein